MRIVSDHPSGLIYGRPGSPAPGLAALVPPQIFRGYQWVEPAPNPAEAPFRLASIARFLYPVGCLACERPRPWL